MKSKLFYSLILLSALLPATVQAQTENAQADARIEAALDAAIQSDIPVALLESKIAEGKAKNVPLERIALAVESRYQALLRASETLKRARIEATTDSELAVSADALEAGVSQNALLQVSRSAPAERRAVAIATLTGLVQLGHASDQALARVSAVIRSNAGLANLHAEVASQLGLGVAGAAGAAGAANAGIRIR